MSGSMPYEPSVPCAACTRAIDPLRAGAVSVFDDGERFFCGSDCRDVFRAAIARKPPRMPTPFDLAPRRDEVSELIPIERPVPPPPPQEAPLTRAWPALSALAALAVGLIPGVIPAILASLVLMSLTFVMLMRTEPSRAEVGTLGWLAGPVGVVLLTLSGVFSTPSAAHYVGAALGVILLWLRESLAERVQKPLDTQLAALAGAVPERTRVSMPSLDEGGAPTVRESQTAGVRAGEVVLVEAGEVVPVDGVVESGEAQVLPYPMASAPVRREPGAALLAGARIIEGSLQVTASRVGAARALFRARTFGHEGTDGAAPITGLAVRAKSPLTFTVIGAVALLLALASCDSLGMVMRCLGAALVTVPVLSLVLGVKLPFLSAGAVAVSHGVVFRDASALERAGRISAAALCTDGTVTEGKAQLIEVSPLGRSAESDELTALAMGAELVAEPHPLAQAVRRFGQARGLIPTTIRRAAYQRGRGVTALADGGGPLVLGNRQSLLTAGVSVAVADREAQRAESQGRTVVFLAVGGRVRALFVFEDPVRPEARAAVQKLIDLDVEVLLLSGDHRATVEALARTLDITHVKAELLAEERAAEVGRLREAGGEVAVIGRAPQDEASLSVADVSITLDAAGSAREGDIAISSMDLGDAAHALWIARQARRTARSVVITCAALGLGLATLAALGMLPPALILLGALGIDAWALPSATRLLRREQRERGAPSR